MEIVRRMCPSWEIRPSRNTDFGADDVDQEIMEDIEPMIQGLKMTLNVTEFLITPKPVCEIFPQDPNHCYGIRCEYSAISDERDTYPQTLQELLSFPKVGTGYRHGSRFIHTYHHGGYGCGRHTTCHPTIDVTNMVPIWIVHFAHFPWNEPMRNRRMQIQTRMPDKDKRSGAGIQHIVDATKCEEWRDGIVRNGIPVPEEMRYVISLILAQL